MNANYTNTFQNTKSFLHNQHNYNRLKHAVKFDFLLFHLVSYLNNNFLKKSLNFTKS